MKKTILVVEDDLAIRESLIELLEQEGYASVAAANGQQALEQLRRPLAIDLILLDLMMPIMDGRIFLQRLRAEHSTTLRDVPVVLLTAAGDRATDVDGVSTIIKKPIDVDHLLKTIAQIPRR